MKVTDDTTAVNFNNSVYTNTYVSNWSGEVEFVNESGDGTEFAEYQRANRNSTVDSG